MTSTSAGGGAAPGPAEAAFLSPSPPWPQAARKPSNSKAGSRFMYRSKTD
jgi:hypothetical protein